MTFIQSSDILIGEDTMQFPDNEWKWNFEISENYPRLWSFQSSTVTYPMRFIVTSP